MKVTLLPAVDPATVRASAGFSPLATWYSPRKPRPGAYRALNGNPEPADRESA